MPSEGIMAMGRACMGGVCEGSMPGTGMRPRQRIMKRSCVDKNARVKRRLQLRRRALCWCHAYCVESYR